MPNDITIIDPADTPPDPGPGKLATQAMRGRLPVSDLIEAARIMARSPLIPFLLRRSGNLEETIANCYLIISQAQMWGMDPMAVASQAYVIDGKLSYMGQLIAALINTRAGLKSKLSVDFTGEGFDLTCTVSGEFKGEKKPRTKTLRRKDVQGKSELWQKDPQNKLWYTTVLAWARLHWPEGVLGIHDDAEPDPIRINTVTEVVSNGEQATNEKPQETRTPQVAEVCPSGEGDGQTLQAALGEQAAAVAHAEAGKPGDPCEFFLQERVKASFTLLFTTMGIDLSPEGAARRKEITAKALNKRGVSHVAHLTNAQGAELADKLDAEIARLHAAKEAEETKH